MMDYVPLPSEIQNFQEWIDTASSDDLIHVEREYLRFLKEIIEMVLRGSDFTDPKFLEFIDDNVFLIAEYAPWVIRFHLELGRRCNANIDSEPQFNWPKQGTEFQGNNSGSNRKFE